MNTQSYSCFIYQFEVKVYADAEAGTFYTFTYPNPYTNTKGFASGNDESKVMELITEDMIEIKVRKAVAHELLDHCMKYPTYFLHYSHLCYNEVVYSIPLHVTNLLGLFKQ